MKKYAYLLLVFVLMLVGCSTQGDIESPVDPPSATEDLPENTIEEPLIFIDTPVRFVVDEGVDVLSAMDDYMVQYSTFDWMSKFKSEVPLDSSEVAERYKDSLLLWNADEIERIENVLIEVEALVSKYAFKMPDELWFIKENGTIEGGAAYTRGNAIIFPQRFLNAVDDEGLKFLVLHELFHVISRHNKELRPDLYSIIHYEQCEPLELTGDFAERTLANPDAPDLNYFIECSYRDELKTFIPVLYSNEPYDISTGESFFKFLNDDMLLVDIIEGVPTPVLGEDGQPVIVKKDSLDNYYDLIGNNTRYTYHPEETMADNFVFMVLQADGDVPNPEILVAMREVFGVSE